MRNKHPNTEIMETIAPPNKNGSKNKKYSVFPDWKIVRFFSLLIERPFIKKLYSDPTIILSFLALYIAIMSYKNANRQFEINSNNSDSIFHVQLSSSETLNEKLITDNRTLAKKNSHLLDSLYNVQFSNEKNNNLSLLSEIKQLQLITDSLIELSKNTLEYSVYSERPELSLLDLKIERNDSISTETTFNGTITFNINNSGKRIANNIHLRTFVFSKLLLIIKSDFKSRVKFNLSDGSSPQFVPVSMSNNDSKDFYILIETSYIDSKSPGEKCKIAAFRYNKLGNGKFIFAICDDIDKNNLKLITNKYLMNNHAEILRLETN